MFKIEILEDEQSQATQMKKFLSQYETEREDVCFGITCYDRGFKLLDAYHCDADLLLLDIRVPDMLGMEVAHRIRAIDPHVIIIFVTSLTEYAVEGYEVQAFDYIVKPVSYPLFAAKMDRVMRMSASRNSKTIIQLKTKSGIRRLASDEILYMEIANHDIEIHTGTETFHQWGSLSHFEKELAGAGFARCNSCYLVNLKYVQEIRSNSVVVAGNSLIISAPRRKTFLAELAQYRGGSR